MKIRNGFVSNSSSSSFCMAGVSWKTESEIGEKLYRLYDDGLPGVISIVFDEYTLYTGIYISAMGMDETKAQFLERAYLELVKFGIENDVPELSSLEKTRVNIFDEIVNS